MNNDVAAMVGAVRRELLTVERDGKPARMMVAERRYQAPIDEVWDAVTTAERLSKWFTPITGDLNPGGRYQLQGNASGTILRCEPPGVIDVTWEYGGDVSWVNVRLVADGEATLLWIEHIAHVPEEFWDQFGPGAVGVGWDLGLLGLHMYLTTGQAVAQEIAATYHTTDDGRAFIIGASEAWGEASVAGGTDAAAAREAMKRTTAFYTGEPAS